MCSDSPDMSGVNAAAIQNAEVGREMAGIARDQLAMERSRQAQFDPIYKQILQSSLQQQQLGAEQSAEQWKSYRDTWQPLEKKLAQTAAEFDTPERRASEAEAAAADVGIQYGAQRQALDRDLNRSNTTVSSGKSLALRAGAALDQAKATASAQGNARRQVEQAGIALVDNAAKFGRNMTSTGIETARLSLGAGQAASGTMGQQQATSTAGLSAVQGLYGGSIGATGSAGNLFGTIAGIQQQTNAANQELLGTAAGAGVTALAL